MTRQEEEVSKLLERVDELETENERLKGELKRREVYDEAVPDPRHHKYFNYECGENGCRNLAWVRRCTDLAARLKRVEEALREIMCETKCGFAYSTARAALAPAPDTGQSGSGKVASVQVSPVEREWDNAADDAAWKDL